MRLRLLALWILLLVALPRAGASEPFYFIGKPAPAFGPDAVFLRWDLLDGQLPGDIEQFRLLRDGELIAERPARGLLTPAEITALYQMPSARRFYLDSLASLQRLARGSEQVPDFAVEAFPQALHAQLLREVDPNPARRDPSWALLAARRDPLIALARHRGFIDRPGVGPRRYELLAVQAGTGETRRVGLLEIDPQRPVQLLPPVDFQQVVQGQCDELERSKDHYTVALGWRAPGGAGLADRLASQLFTAGYWLYRSRDPIPLNQSEAPPRNLAAEAQGLTPTADGRLPFAGLEPVSDVLLNLDGPASGPLEPGFIETRPELERAGLRPGDRRAYYLVAQDFAGGIGPTVGSLVTVPDHSRPPAPWDVNVVADPGRPDRGIELNWPAADVDNVIELFLGRNRVCNLDEARTTGLLHYVGPEELCETAPQRDLRVDATTYRVYRFEDFDAASRFLDADGDGFTDAFERAEISAERLSPGAQCDARARPAGRGALADGGVLRQDRLPVTGRGIVRFIDQIPADNLGRVYWYRIAAVGPGGTPSHLSAPVRAIFPDRRLPQSPQLRFETEGDANCDCEVELRNPDRAWRFDDAIRSTPNLSLFAANGTPLGENVPVSALASVDGVYCTALGGLIRENFADGPLRVRYQIDNSLRGGRFCEAALPEGISFCQRGELALVRKDCDPRPVTAGARVAGRAEIVAEFPAGSCGSVFQRIAGTDTRIVSSCGTDTPETLRVPVRSTQFCGYAVSQDGNNNLSPRASIPCFVVQDEAFVPPPPPQPVALGYFNDDADVRWRLPVEPVSATLIELRREADGETLLRGVPQAEIPDGDIERADLRLPPIQFPDERWCLRLRTVLAAPEGGRAAQSEWTAPLCSAREGPAIPPSFLPWPVIPEAPQGLDLGIELASAGPAFGSELGDVILPLTEIGGLDPVCNLKLANADRESRVYYRPLTCQPSVPARFAGALAEWAPFIVYRESRAPDGSRGELLQVSPLIDRAHWDEVKTTSGNTRSFNDPWLELRALDVVADRWQLVFVDRYPKFLGFEYRYQLVRLDANNRLQEWRQSDWIAPSIQAITLNPSGMTP